MQPNPVLRRLGFSDNDRVVIFHADDIGMNLGSVEAFADLWEFGLISSGAIMFPCPWSLYAASYAKQHPEADLGVHTTLTSEWQTYRWGPISTRDPNSGLIDPQGYFYSSTHQAQENGGVEYVAREIQAQVDQAFKLGMHPTHMDTHMGTVASMKFIPSYIKTAIAYRLPAMLFRMDADGWMAEGLDQETAAMAVFFMGQLEAMGLPLMDALVGLELDQPDNRLEQAMQAVADLKPGITHFIIHPSKDTPELRAITKDWRARVADYETFMSETLRSFIASQGVHVVGYRQLQDLMPDPAALSALQI
jgi:chitin disaccharide deacetylase